MPAEGVTGWLRGGLHNLAATVVFGSRDSGTASLPVTSASWSGEDVRVTVCRSLDRAAFRLADSASAIWNRLDLAARSQVSAPDLPRGASQTSASCERASRTGARMVFGGGVKG